MALIAVIALGAVLVISRGVQALLGAMRIRTSISKRASDAFHWTLSWGGIARRTDRPDEELVDDCRS
jgi:hypothetical protein